jgi:hypothetical protein
MLLNFRVSPGGSALTPPGRFHLGQLTSLQHRSQAQLLFRCAQMSLGLCAVAGHVVMVGSARMFHLLDRFLHLFVTLLQSVPVAHLRR